MPHFDLLTNQPTRCQLVKATKCPSYWNTCHHPSSASWSLRTDQRECPHTSSGLWCDSKALWDSDAQALPASPWPRHTISTIATATTLVISDSLVWPRHPRASGLASDGWVITIITQETLQGAATRQRPPMFNRIFGCFIGFNSAHGAGERGSGW